MKKKIIMFILALGVTVMAAGCGDKQKTEDTDTETKTESTENTDSTDTVANSDGNVMAVDVDDITKYVNLGEYKNLEVEVTKTEITDDDVDEYIHQQMVYQPEEISEDRPVQEDDTVNIDYTGYMDGEEFEGGSAQGTDLLIGSGQFIDGFESGLIGKKKGEEVTLDLAFSDPYTNNPDYSGKAVQFKVKINSISAAPEISDTWVAENTDVKTVEEYKKTVKDSLTENADMQYMNQLKSNLFQKVVGNSEIIEYPQELMDAEIEAMNERVRLMYAEPSGMTLDEYWEAQGISEEDADTMMEQMAKSSLQQNLIVQAIFNAEGISLTEDEYKDEKEAFAKEYGFADSAALDSTYSDAGIVKSNVLWNKACAILNETAKVTEVAESEADSDAAASEE